MKILTNRRGRQSSPDLAKPKPANVAPAVRRPHRPGPVASSCGECGQSWPCAEAVVRECDQ